MVLVAFTAFEEFVHERMNRTKLAAVSVAVVQGGQVAYARGFGCRDSEKGLPATPRTLYGIGSVTKSFTCAAILQLQEQGKLNVEDPVDRYLDFPLRPKGQPVRISHLMSHTSGIPALAYAEAMIGHGQGSGDPYLAIGSPEDVLTFMSQAGDWVLNAPGERWYYLNEGYVLLGEIIARVSGEPYADYVTRHILEPLGMRRSFFDKDRVDADPDAAVPYVEEREGRHRPGRYLYGRILSDGGLISNVEDMAQYVLMFLGEGRGPSGAVLSAESVRQMRTPRVATPPEEIPASGDWAAGKAASHYGFGLSAGPFFGRTLVGHTGSVGVATAAMAFVPEAGIGAMVLANGSGYPLANVAHYALVTMLGEDPWTLPALSLERALLAWEGVYETYRGTMRVRVQRVGDTLDVAFQDEHGEERVPLMPFRATPDAARFFMLSGGRRVWVDFERTGGGRQFVYERYLFRRTGNL